MSCDVTQGEFVIITTRTIHLIILFVVPHEILASPPIIVIRNHAVTSQ